MRGALVGSVAETSSDPDRPYNTSVLIAPSGAIAATYRKIHLFDVAVDSGPADTESARVMPGDAAVCAVVDGIAVGLTICYDLRFAELYRTLALAGAQVLTVPADFTSGPGATIGRSSSGRGPSRTRRGPGAVADRWAAGPAGLRTIDDHRPVGHGRGAGVRCGRDRDRGHQTGPRSPAVRRQIPVLANRRPEAYRLD